MDRTRVEGLAVLALMLLAQRVNDGTLLARTSTSYIWRLQDQEEKDRKEKEGAHLVPSAMRVLDELGQITGRSYRPFNADGDPTSNLRFIMARLRSGLTEEDLIGVVHQQALAWRGDPKMWPYMRPETLFNETKCEQYVARILARKVTT